jgi:hypothetical protein
VFHALKIVLKQYKISLEKTGNHPNLSRGGGPTPTFGKTPNYFPFFVVEGFPYAKARKNS